MKMFNIVRAIIFIPIVIGMFSCDYLSVDDYFDDQMKFDSIFVNKRNLERYMWGVAGDFPDEGRIFGNEVIPGITGTDEIFTLMKDDLFRGKAFTLGKVTADNLQGLGVWNPMYKIIRKANMILGRMDECQDLTTLDKREILGYTHFIRGYAYYQLLMVYGPAIIVGDDVYASNLETKAYDKSRSTFDETVDYVCDELEKAAAYMPEVVSASQYGRPTRGAAYALIARVRLHAASPAFNGGEAARRYFGNWKRSEDGKMYVSMDYDEQKWALAAAAAKRVIDMNAYTLHTIQRDSKTPVLPSTVPSAPFPEGAGDIDPYRSYSEMFTGETYPVRNEEFIWSRMSGEVSNYTQQSFPVYLGGYNGMSVTQKIVDAYRMVDGQTIDEALQSGEYSETGFTMGSKTFSGYRLNSNVYSMYANREMRFYASVGFSNCFWTAGSTTNSSFKNQTVNYALDGNAGRNATNEDLKNYPITGYVLRKYVHPDDAWTGDASMRMDKAFPIIRYAEILLSYAEALNNLNESYTVTLESGQSYTLSRDVNEMAWAFNQVRYRAGLPGLKTEELASQSTMFNLIVNERMVEFLCEGRRFFDVRRWGIYEEEDSKPISGMDTDATNVGGYYHRKIMDHADYRNRVVDKRMVFLPLDRQDIRKMSKLDQNPGWAN